MSVGSLVVKIGADISGIRRDAQRGADSLGGLEGATKKLGFALKALAVGAVANELKSMVSEAMDAIDAQAKLSRQLGGTIDGLQGLELAASEAGVSTGALASGAEMLNRRLGEAARRGAGQAHEALTRLGLDARDLSAMDLDLRMASVADAIRETGLSSQATADTLAQLGIRQGEFSRLLVDGGSAIRAARDSIDALGLSLSEVDAAKIEAANDAMSRVKLASTAVARRLAVELSPVLTAISNQFLDAASDSEAIKDSVDTVVEYVVKGLGYMGNVVRGIHLVFKSVELGMWALGTGIVEVFRFGTKGISSFVDSGIEKVNELIGSLNELPGIDITPVALTGDSKFMKAFDEFAAAMRATTADVFEQLGELATKEWPSDKAEAFYRSIQEAAQGAADQVTRTRREMLSFDDVGGGSNEEEQKELDKYRERLGAQLNVLREHVMTKEELATAHHATRLDQLNAALDAQLVSQTEFARISEGLEERHMDELAKIREHGMDQVHDISVSSMASQARQITGMLMNLTSSAARENKAMFEAHKAFAISDAVLSGASGVAQTLGAYPYPFNLGFAAAHAAMAAAQVGVISSKQFEGRSRTVSAPVASSPVGGARGPAPAGGGVSGEATGGQSQLVSINLQGDTFSREMVTSLIEGINEAIKDGARLVVA